MVFNQHSLTSTPPCCACACASLNSLVPAWAGIHNPSLPSPSQLPPLPALRYFGAVRFSSGWYQQPLPLPSPPLPRLLPPPAQVRLLGRVLHLRLLVRRHWAGGAGAHVRQRRGAAAVRGLPGGQAAGGRRLGRELPQLPGQGGAGGGGGREEEGEEEGGRREEGEEGIGWAVVTRQTIKCTGSLVSFAVAASHIQSERLFFRVP